ASLDRPPGTPASHSGAGTGFTRESIGINGSDYGLQITLKDGNAHNAIAPGWFFPVDVWRPGPGSGSLCTGQGAGGDCYRDAIESCSPVIIGPGNTLVNEPGNKQGPTRQGVQALIDQDLGASWDTSLNNGKGGIAGGCQASTVSPCAKSPRLVAVPVFDVDEYDAGKASGRQDIVIVKILGFFIESVNNQGDVTGYLCYYPGPPRVNPSGANIQGAS